MKQILKPSSKEESIYFSDFTGKVLPMNSVPVTIKIECSYESYMDENKTEIHLTDEEARSLLLFIKSNLTQESFKNSSKFWNEVI